MTTMRRAARAIRWQFLALGIWAWGPSVLPLVGVPVRAEPLQKAGEGNPAPIRIHVSFGRDLSATPIDGRLLVMLSTDDKDEPRLQINDGPKTQQIFGIDLDALAPDQEVVIDETTRGYPLESLRQVPAGRYRVQALLHRYETFHRADGHTVKLPMDRGEGQHWNRAPGISTARPARS